ncbi:MAG: hypothetical protein M1835_003689 [Candelina submexicana]|nr:MAG: hypothetical protein M1835_003689 [Candelina submexicana]
MDMQSLQAAMGSSPLEQGYPMPGSQDQEMGGTEEGMSTTPTSGYNGYSNGQPQFPRHQASQSADYPPSHQAFSPPPDAEPNARYSPLVAYQQQPMQPVSRPSSGLSGSGERYGYPPSNSYQEQSQRGAQQQGTEQRNKNSVVIKVGMVGDAQIGKTSLMVKYVEGSWDEDYIQTLGVNFMEKTISIRNTEITFSIWDLGGQREFVNMLPLVCNDAVAILFMFDLTRKSTLNSIKEWYRQGRGFNKTAIPFLVGTKYDHFVNFPREDQEEISNQVGSSLSRTQQED